MGRYSEENTENLSSWAIQSSEKKASSTCISGLIQVFCIRIYLGGSFLVAHFKHKSVNPAKQSVACV